MLHAVIESRLIHSSLAIIYKRVKKKKREAKKKKEARARLNKQAKKNVKYVSDIIVFLSFLMVFKKTGV